MEKIVGLLMLIGGASCTILGIISIYLDIKRNQKNIRHQKLNKILKA